jgi:hypothetical protein
MSGELQGVRWGAETRGERDDLSMEKRHFCMLWEDKNRPVAHRRPGEKMPMNG